MLSVIVLSLEVFSKPSERVRKSVGLFEWVVTRRFSLDWVLDMRILGDDAGHLADSL